MSTEAEAQENIAIASNLQALRDIRQNGHDAAAFEQAQRLISDTLNIVFKDTPVPDDPRSRQLHEAALARYGLGQQVNFFDGGKTVILPTPKGTTPAPELVAWQQTVQTAINTGITREEISDAAVPIAYKEDTKAGIALALYRIAGCTSNLTIIDKRKIDAATDLVSGLEDARKKASIWKITKATTNPLDKRPEYQRVFPPPPVTKSQSPT